MGGDVRRWIVTGAPGAGKTTLVRGLADRGHVVVAEAATEVVAAHGAGDAHWERAGFLDDIVALQRSRRLAPVPAGAASVVFDRSPVCTLALARHMDVDVTPALAAELAEIEETKAFQRQVLYVRWLGFLTPTAVRRITEEQTRHFDRIHRETYLELGYELVEIPVLPVDERVGLAERLISSAG